MVRVCRKLQHRKLELKLLRQDCDTGRIALSLQAKDSLARLTARAALALAVNFFISSFPSFSSFFLSLPTSPFLAHLLCPCSLAGMH